MEFDRLKTASAFSWAGRHAAELRLLTNSLGTTPKHVLNAGCGPFEPFYLAEMFFEEETMIHAIDFNPQIYNFLCRLLNGENIPLADLALVSCNKDDQSQPISNTDLTDPQLIGLGLKELRLAGIDPNRFVTEGHFHQSTNTKDRNKIQPAKIILACADMQEYARQHKGLFGLIYSGVVLPNTAKTRSISELVEIVKDLADSLTEEGVLGIGTTPAYLYGDKGDPNLIRQAGLTITDLIVDNLVQVGGKLRGGYLIRAVKNPNHPSQIGTPNVKAAISSDHLLSQIECQKREISAEQLAAYLRRENENLILAALKTEKRENYFLFEAKRADLTKVVPSQRETLSIIPKVVNYNSNPSH